jgi:signal transduction histidine kinase
MANPIADFQAFTRSFEEQRQQRLLTLLIPIGLILIGIAIIGGAVAIFTNSAQPGMQVTVSFSVILFGCLVAAEVLLRRGRIDIATLLFIISTVSTVLGIVVVLAVATPFSPQSLVQLACLSIVILLAGAVGDTRSIVFTAALEGLTIAVVMLVVQPAPNDAVSSAILQQRVIIIIAILTYHLAGAALLVAVSNSLRGTLETLNQTYEQLSQAQQIDDLKDQFITQVNHELRTPIMSLQGYVDLIYELDDSLTIPDRKLMLTRARSAGENLIRFVNDVLDTRRVDQDVTFERMVTPVRPAIADALMVIPPTDQRPVQVDVAGEIAIWGEPTRLRQVLTNLVSNAVKYSPVGSPIEITAWNQGDMVEIDVRDYGFGIPRGQAEALFHRFVRLERDLRSRVRGTGVGLYLCRTYVEAMGGTITVESSGIPGEGSRFIIHLPAFAGLLDTPELTPTRKLSERSR